MHHSSQDAIDQWEQYENVSIRIMGRESNGFSDLKRNLRRFRR